MASRQRIHWIGELGVIAALLLAAAPIAWNARVAVWDNSPTTLEPTLIDPNVAPRALLLTLPQLGPTALARLLAERDRAPFASLQDIDRRVARVGPVTIGLWRTLLDIPDERNPAAFVPGSVLVDVTDTQSR